MFIKDICFYLSPILNFRYQLLNMVKYDMQAFTFRGGILIMEISQNNFGQANGHPVTRYTVANDHGVRE